MNRAFAVAIILIFITSLAVSVPLVKAQSISNIVINPDGSITGTYSIQQVGNTYTLTGNISASSIQVEKSNIVINGAGYTLDGNGNGGIDLTNNVQHEYNNPTISNVTIENMFLRNGGISTNGGGNDTFYNDYFSSGNLDHVGSSIILLGCSYNNISYCSFDNGSQISMDYSANFEIVTKCNLPPNGILIWLSGSEAVDRNYWSDYSTKCPNATEVDHSGIGNTPYVFLTLSNGAQPAVFQDNHPLMKPVTIPLMGSNPQLNIPEFPLLAVVLAVIMAMSMLGAVAVLAKKRIAKT